MPFFRDDARRVRLGDIGLRETGRFTYDHDLGARWRHDLRVFALERGALAPGTVGLQLDEAKDLLAAVQEKMVAGRPRPPRPRRRPARSAGSAPS